MFSLLFDSGFWYDLIFIVLIGFIIFLCFKYPNSRVYVFSFLGIVFVGFTAYCGIQLNFYYSAEGGVWGYINGLIDNNTATTEVTDTIKYSLENIVLTQNPDGSFSATIYSDDKFELKQDTSYGVYVNDEPCTQVDFSSNFVRAEYRYAFLDNDLEVLMDDTLQFNIAFYENSSSFTLTTHGGQEAVDYWNKYFSRNNLVVEVKPTDYTKDNQLTINGSYDEYVTLNYYVGDEIKYTNIYLPGYHVTSMPIPKDSENKLFAYWANKEGEKVDELTITQDTDLYAVFTETLVVLDTTKEITLFADYHTSVDETINLNDYVEMDLTRKNIVVDFNLKIQNTAGEMYYVENLKFTDGTHLDAIDKYGDWLDVDLLNSNLKLYCSGYANIAGTSNQIQWLVVTLNKITVTTMSN